MWLWLTLSVDLVKEHFISGEEKKEGRDEETLVKRKMKENEFKKR
jgi:hypothetical protein